ncbi:MAG: hypothetical protein OHK0024_29880 [Thalassobaculales bacterium]
MAVIEEDGAAIAGEAATAARREVPADLREKRLDSAFAEAARANHRRVLWLRTLALAVIAGFEWMIFPMPGVLFPLVMILAFALAGLIHAGVLTWRPDAAWASYLLVAVDAALLAFTLYYPNPFLDNPLPRQVALKQGGDVFFYVVIVLTAMSYSPPLTLWGGICSAGAYAVAFLIITGFDLSVPPGPEPWRDVTWTWWGVLAQTTFVMVLVAALLSALTWRSRRLVLSQARAERGRAALARYFSPNMVEVLDRAGGALPSRRQQVAVLFADVKGFTALSERMPPEALIAFLRDLQREAAEAVFGAGGTLDKYIGDCVMATFGTPDPGPRDATNALAAARAMAARADAAAVAAEARGEQPLRLGIGIHYGPVVAGDVGDARRLEYTVIGDAVNVAARLERLTRDLDAEIVISRQLADQVRRESPDMARVLLAGFEPLGAQQMRGRAEPVEVLAYRPAAAA